MPEERAAYYRPVAEPAKRRTPGLMFFTAALGGLALVASVVLTTFSVANTPGSATNSWLYYNPGLNWLVGLLSFVAMVVAGIGVLAMMFCWVPRLEYVENYGWEFTTEGRALVMASRLGYGALHLFLALAIVSAHLSGVT